MTFQKIISLVQEPIGGNVLAAQKPAGSSDVRRKARSGTSAENKLRFDSRQSAFICLAIRILNASLDKAKNPICGAFHQSLRHTNIVSRRLAHVAQRAPGQGVCRRGSRHQIGNANFLYVRSQAAGNTLHSIVDYRGACSCCGNIHRDCAAGSDSRNRSGELARTSWRHFCFVQNSL